MFTKNKRISLLNYWTSRYLLTLFVGLAIISLIFAFWIRHTALETRLEMMEFLADEYVYRLTDTSRQIGWAGGPTNPDFIGDRERFNMSDIDPILYILDTEGNIITSNRLIPPGSSKNIGDVLDGQEGVKKFTAGEGKGATVQYVVRKKIEQNERVVGWVLVLEKKNNLTKVNQAYGQLAILIVGMALLGWLAIYFLTRRLARPIKKVAVAARQVQEGNYKIDLPIHIKEEEVYELVASFKEMATKLEQLEKTRTELLAGVTHELKTPVTSISGLLQAVKDGIITGKDADEFIKMALIETTKMKTMVGDLLAFNTFAVDAIPVKLVKSDINRLVKDAVTQWEVMQEEDTVQVDAILLDKPIYVHVDIVRFQQILTNLLTNAIQAMQEGVIMIRLQETDSAVKVTVQDTGVGIPKEDQAFIFERFYRGENKKYTVRGLGLGLPLSKMMAQSVDGDLRLIESSDNGTTFEITLIKVR